MNQHFWHTYFNYLCLFMNNLSGQWMSSRNTLKLRKMNDGIFLFIYVICECWFKNVFNSPNQPSTKCQMYVKAGQKLVSLISIFSPWLIFLHVFCLSRTPSSPLMFLWMFLHVKCNNTRHQVKNRFDNNGVYEVTHYVISDGMRIFHLFTEKLMLHYVLHTLPVKL